MLAVRLTNFLSGGVLDHGDTVVLGCHRLCSVCNLECKLSGVAGPPVAYLDGFQGTCHLPETMRDEASGKGTARMGVQGAHLRYLRVRPTSQTFTIPERGALGVGTSLGWSRPKTEQKEEDALGQV